MNTPILHQLNLRTCLDRRFKLIGESYSWRSTIGMFEVAVRVSTTGSGNNLVHVDMRDLLSDLIVDDWSTSVRCHHNWRERLQEQVGKALARAQHRPSCPRCSHAGERTPMVVKNSTRNRRQFFGCSRFRDADCHFTLDLAAAFEPHGGALPAPQSYTKVETTSPSRMI